MRGAGNGPVSGTVLLYTSIACMVSCTLHIVMYGANSNGAAGRGLIMDVVLCRV